ncbi:hypothetical protein [Nocardia sp. NPDC059228]|uniref:hypothetical protein n=1 Tax=Nocardia sp. NPDC059228 TaxID=3346777 RepID=UPI0036860704
MIDSSYRHRLKGIPVLDEQIIFSSIEAALVDFLTSRLIEPSSSVTVATRTPEPRPSRMVRVSRNDRKYLLDLEDYPSRRGANRILDRPRVVFECFDDSGDAVELASKVRGIINAAAPGYIGTVWCDYVEDVGEENDTDPVTAAPRYTIVTDLIVRGKVLA